LIQWPLYFGHGRRFRLAGWWWRGPHLDRLFLLFPGTNLAKVRYDPASAGKTSVLSKADWYRARAADCVMLAERAPNDSAKSILNQMAATWLRLAELVDKIELNESGDDDLGGQIPKPRE
jgi:hypothetical protein